MGKQRWRGWTGALLALACLGFSAAGYGQEGAQGSVILLTVEGIIDPVAARYLDRQVKRAGEEGARLVVVKLDTPGGLDTSMRAITKTMINSRVPTAVWVAPAGGRAASAGAFIGMAANLLAMAPGTNVGAAHPVGLQGQKASDKIVNDAAAYIASLAKLRNRPEEIAVRMVRKSLSLPAAEAVQLGVADFQAQTLEDLLQKAEGRPVTQAGQIHVLNVAGKPAVPRPMAWTETFIHALSNPNLAYILFLIGIYGIIYELASPGAIFPGVAGAICLLLAIMGFEGLPISMVGIILIVLGAALLVMEIFIVSQGFLAAGGAVALILGSFMLLPSDPPVFRIASSILWTMVALSVGFVVALVYVVIRNRRRTVSYSGTEGLVGARGWVKSAVGREIVVHVQGEEWSALSDQPLVPDQPVEVVAVEGLYLRVRPVAD